MKNINIILFISGFFLINTAFSEADVVNTQAKNSVIQNSEINTTQLDIAKDWNLTDSEWHHYLILMQGTSGHYYEHLSPPEVLGINADTMDDTRHFAELSVKLAHDRLEKEIKFNTAFHEAATKLYSSEKIIKPFDLSPFNPIQKN